MDAVQLIGGVLLSVAVIAMFGAVLWSLFDVVVRATEVPVVQRVMWVVFLVGFNILAAAVYVRLGPGSARWQPWAMWRRART